MIEIDFGGNPPSLLLIIYAIHTTFLVFIHLLSLMLATCLLPELEAVSKLPHSQLETNSTLSIVKIFTVQLCWVLSNIVGIIIFITEVILIAFVKFFPGKNQDPNNLHAGTATLILVVILTVFSLPLIVYQSRVISKHKLRLHERQLGQAQQMLEEINLHMETTIQEPLKSVCSDTCSTSSYHSGNNESVV